MDSDEDEDDEEDRARLNETGKAVKKALRKLEKNKAYDDDDEKDPYASVSQTCYSQDRFVPLK
jgi:transcription initiation factor TFIIF subunit alpha